MSGFSEQWLRLRESLDHRSRSAALVERLSADSPPGPRRIVDLGAGTGSNLRYLAPRLGGQQDWLLVDSDETLLEATGARLGQWAAEHALTLQEREDVLILRGAGLRCGIRRLKLDLARDWGELPLEDCWLLTASALIDLVSRDWLEAIVSSCRSAEARLLFTLTYDGMIRWEPTMDDDARVRALVNRHQTRDKGFGQALGPRAASAGPDLIRRQGYDVFEASTPWDIDSVDVGLQCALLEGWAAAAREQDPGEQGRLSTWRDERRNLIAAGASRLCVGHRDLLALPTAQEGGRPSVSP